MSGAILKGGTAAGLEFTGLSRFPTFVRVVLGPSGHFDILNDLDDQPRDDEQVVGVYLKDDTSQVWVRGTRGTGGEWWTYVHLPTIGVERLRDDDTWVERVAALSNVTPAMVRDLRARER